MADIFISYSSKDKEKADQLSELLASAGLSVWIDKQGIVGAEKWATEIVEGIRACSTFIILLSSNSIESENVLRELSLASEKGKRVLPVDLEPTVLPASFEYPLAGLQRVPITDFDKILHAHKHGIRKVIRKDTRKTLMILPFEDLSPSQDNEWFANGIVSELISSLSNVRALRLIDTQTTKEFKSYKGQLSVYAKEMGIRYFVQGDVRKLGDQIKISSRLLDIESGDYLWQDSFKGRMEDIFDMQETVARKVVEGLKIHLASDETKKLAQRGTENPEAYELYLKGIEYFVRHTRADYERALGLLEEAARLDIGFADAYLEIANAALELYAKYSREGKWLTKASENIAQAETVFGTSREIYWIRSKLACNLGNYEEALHLATLAIEIDPEYVAAYDILGFAYLSLGKPEAAVDARKKNVKLRDYDRIGHFNYLIALNELGDTLQLAEAAAEVLPMFERYLRLTPDDLSAGVQYASILSMAGYHERALAEARKLEETEGLDPKALYNIACLYVNEGAAESGLRALQRSVARGFLNIELFQRDPDLHALRGLPEFDELVKELERKIDGRTNV